MILTFDYLSPLKMANEFVSYVTSIEHQEGAQYERLMLHLSLLQASVLTIDVSKLRISDETFDPPDCNKIGDKVTRHFHELGYYWSVVSTELEEDATVCTCDAADDLIEIVCHLTCCLDAEAAGLQDHALWLMKLLYDSGWRDHLVNLQLHLSDLMAR